MKSLFLISFLLVSATVLGQTVNTTSGISVLENDKVSVVEYTSQPQGTVCGEGMHNHEAHLTILLSDAKVSVTSQNGESKDIEVSAGSSFWSESESHAVVNTGAGPVKILLVYLKEK